MMATAGIDLESALLDQARAVRWAFDRWDEAYAYWKSVQDDPRYSGGALAKVKRCRVEIDQRADHILHFADLGPQHLKADLFHASTRLRDLDRDVPRMLTDAAAALTAVPDENAGNSEPATPFVPNTMQRAILQSLDGRALKKQPLADEVCGGEGSRLYNGKTRNGDINELRDLKLIDNKPRLGFYRPDAPPR